MTTNYQFHLIQAIRNFFTTQDFMDILTPPLVTHPGMEPHIHPFSLFSPHSKSHHSLYLHTSPEFYMKKLLADGWKKIFTINYCFRDEPLSPIHRPQFIMLEWYRAHQRYEMIMQDFVQLVHHCALYLQEQGAQINLPLQHLNFEKTTVQQLFQEYLQIDILQFLDKDELRKLIALDFSEVPLPALSADSQMLWEDYYFLLFLNKIEPFLHTHPLLILYEYPAPLAALSTIKKSDPRVCERFEVYIHGIEIANCYNELIDLPLQKQRFHQQNLIKQQLYNYQLPEPGLLWNAMEKGLPLSAGIALGVNRLLQTLTNCSDAFFDEDVVIAPLD